MTDPRLMSRGELIAWARELEREKDELQMIIHANDKRWRLGRTEVWEANNACLELKRTLWEVQCDLERERARARFRSQGPDGDYY